MASVPVLSDYLASLAKRTWQPGVLDCGVFMADWVRLICGVDPIADVRGKYSSEREFMRIVRREGGFEESCGARLRAVGMRETFFPSQGAIMTVLAPYAIRRGKIQTRPTGAIAVTSKFRAIITSDLGIVISNPENLPMLKAWTLGA